MADLIYELAVQVHGRKDARSRAACRRITEAVERAIEDLSCEGLPRSVAAVFWRSGLVRKPKAKKVEIGPPDHAQQTWQKER